MTAVWNYSVNKEVRKYE